MRVDRDKLIAQTVGRYARSIESGWLGKVLEVEGIHEDTMLRMQGVDTLAWQVAGGDIEDWLDDDDIQWFAPEDVRFVLLWPLFNES